MLFYKMTFTCDLAEEKHENPAADKRFRQEESFSRRREESYICRCNEKLYDALGSSSKFCFITGYGPGGDCVTAVFSVKEQEEVSYYSAVLRETLRLPEEVGMEVQEITVFEACKYREAAERKRYLPNITEPVWDFMELHFDRHARSFLSGINGKETATEIKQYRCREILRAAEPYFPDKAFKEEVRRIYSLKNPKKFYGIPVHYGFCYNNSGWGKEMVQLLFQALYKNKRLLGTRITHIFPFTFELYEEENWAALDALCQLARGTMLVLDCTQKSEIRRRRGRVLYAGAPEQDWDTASVRKLVNIMEKYQRETLFVLLEEPGQNVFAKVMDMSGARLPMMQFTEQVGSRGRALRYLSYLLDGCNIKEFVPPEWETILTPREQYTAGDVQADFDNWYNQALQENVYAAYRDCCRTDPAGQNKTDSYTKLQNMVGLQEIKRVIDTILADFHLRKLRLGAGLKCEQKSMHMLFTGNPGSAKTTCARLLAGILKEQGLLKTGTFVECGRSDLVGQYVGWTAKIVKEKFAKARGGVLFIDEAYALNSNDKFGPEAMNTIVQEMENHRDDVIVIFAGYPEPMEKFVQANEGFRSRIAFHLNFPDYNVEDLTQIFQLMLEERGYGCEPEALNVVHALFSAAVRYKEFGNGRFVRNLLEQSIMKQSARLANVAGRNCTEIRPPHRKELTTLLAEDIAVETVQNYKQEKRPIGFQ